MFYNDRLLRKKLLLFLGDMSLLFLSLYGALSVRGLSLAGYERFNHHLALFLPVIFFSLVVYFLFDLYSLRVLKNIYRLFYLFTGAVLFNSLMASSLLYILGYFSSLAPKTVLVLYLGFSWALGIVWRFLFYDWFFSRAKYFKRVIIIGNKQVNENLKKIIVGADGADYLVVGFVSSDDRRRSPFGEVPFLGGWKDLQLIVKKNAVDQVVIGFDYREHPEIVRELSEAIYLGVSILDWPIFYEQVFQKIPTNDIDHFWFITNIDEQDKRAYERMKHLLDLLFAFFGLLVLAVIFPFVAALIKITSSGPVLFRQVRIGRRGKLFTLIKFRTMCVDAENDGVQCATENDPRVIAVGRFMRRTRIDELPQVINILRGEMSLVGPRPERPEWLETLQKEIPFYYKRQQVLPGVTGFAQIMYPYAASVEDSLEKAGYDLYYIKNRSLFLYFKIMLRTIKVMLTMKGR